VESSEAAPPPRGVGVTDGGPEVSVVLPTARGGAFLREAVTSVLEQSLADFELVIVADGCEDAMADIEGRDDRIRVIRQARRGVSVARNVGIRVARAELVAFLDDDDRMLPARLEAQTDALRCRPDAGLCHSQFRVIDGEGVPGPVGHARDVQYLDLLRGEVHVLLPTIMVRKALLEEVGGFDSILRTGEDIEVLYRLAREGELVFLSAVLTEYRRHGANTSGDIRRAAENLTAVLRKHRRVDERAGRAPEVAAANEGLAWAARYGATGAILDGRRAWHDHDVVGAVQGLYRAARLSPVEAATDLVGNRRAFRALLNRRVRPAQIGFP
jgi:glycosyltransferase involved in cell wall biosynthesis